MLTVYRRCLGHGGPAGSVDALANASPTSPLPVTGPQRGLRDLLYTRAAAAPARTSPPAQGRPSDRRAERARAQFSRPVARWTSRSSEGYLEVRRQDGTIGLTRNGSLQTNAKGQLTNGQGMLVQPPITIPPGTDPSNVTIQGNGDVVLSGKTLGQIKLVDVPAPNGLVADGDSIFSATAASGAIRTATGSTLQQNALDGSNVDMGRAMSQMMTAERSYQMSSNAVQYQDQMLQIANST